MTYQGQLTANAMQEPFVLESETNGHIRRKKKMNKIELKTTAHYFKVEDDTRLGQF